MSTEKTESTSQNSLTTADEKWLDYSTKTKGYLRESDYTINQIELAARTVAKGATPAELAFFLNTCNSVGLNPLNKEVWFYKDRLNNVIIFTGRDGYLRKAQESNYFLGVQSSVVYQKDSVMLNPNKGEVEHTYDPTKDRGVIIGAWARVKRKAGLMTLVYVDFKRYNKGNSIWNKYPDEMIVKVAETNALRKSFGISGVQSEHDWAVDSSTNTAKPYNGRKKADTPEEAKRALQHIKNAKSYEVLFQISESLREKYAEVFEAFELKRNQFEAEDVDFEDDNKTKQDEQ